MYGAIIGDIVGSRFEWNNIKTKNFEFFTDQCVYTDDSVLTIAVFDALQLCEGRYEMGGTQKTQNNLYDLKSL